MQVDVQQIKERVAEKADLIHRLRSEVGKVLVGQENMLSRLLVGLLSDGHILLEGVPGLAKTTAIKTLAQAIDTRYQRIQFTPDLLPADLVGTLIYVPNEGTFKTRKGPIFSNFVLADEINRAPSKVQSALLESMQERQVTIGEETFPLDRLFLVLATQNPIEQEGTYPLPEAQVDRFMLKVVIGYPKPDEERKIMDLALEGGTVAVDPVISADEIFAIRYVVGMIYIDEQVKEYILNIVLATRDPNPLHCGRGVRALRRAGICVTEGIRRAEACELIAPFARHVTTGKPFVTLKLAMTLDGRIADAAGTSRWITGAAARKRVHDLRGRVDAILVGRRSACLDDPSLTARGRRKHVPWRIVVDSRGSLAPDARVLRDRWADRTIIATTDRCPARRVQAYGRNGAQVWRMPATRDGVSLARVMARLGRMGLLHVLCEGGGELAAALLRRGLVQRCRLFIAPCLLGGSGVPVIGGRGWPLRSAPGMRIDSIERVGEDILLTLEPALPRRGT